MATKRPLVNYSGTIKELQVGDDITGATGGDVVGPSSSTDNALARFDGTTGKLVQNSVGILSDTGDLSGVPTITDVDYVDFDTTYATALTEGQLGWNGNDTLGLGMKGGNVIQHIGEDQYFYCKATSTITKGQVIMFTGAVGASGVPTGAPATGITDGTYIMGIAAESIATNGFGLVQTFGTLRNVNTSGYVDGDILWYDPTVAGGLTKTKPIAPNVKAQMAAVINGGSSGGGTVLIRINPGSTLGGTDSNAEITSPTAGQVLTYDATAGYWKNTTPAGGGGDAYVGSTNTFTANQIISVTDNTNAALRVTQLGDGDALRVEDEANPDSTPFVIKNDGKVGIGVSTPSYPLDITLLEATSRIYSTQAGKGAMRLASTTVGTMYVGKDYVGSSGWWGNSGEYVIAGTGDFPMDFHTNSVKRVSITSAGGVSFGSSGTAYGTSGQVLTSNGNAPPTWSDPTGGGGTVANGCIYENNLTITSSYTLTTSKNGFSVGPITIASGAVVTVPSGQRWVVL
jgi:hypothetical protein